MLIAALEAQAPTFSQVLDERGAQAAIRDLLGIPVSVSESTSSGCSVAGSCDLEARTITVVRASPGRMRFTALHELAHLLGDLEGEFQDTLASAPQTKRNDEEDACEAFAAGLLLPDAAVDPVLGAHGLTARGFIELTEATTASREASAVALAHRMVAPGYVALIDEDLNLRFAARSGDTFPLARGSAQGTGIAGKVRESRTVRERGRLVYGSGARTDEMYVDARWGPSNLLYVVATTDTPGWDVLQIPGTTRMVSSLGRGWCENCQESFVSTRRCANCGELTHQSCGRCGCEVTVSTPQLICRDCHYERPAHMFRAGSAVCTECV